MQPLAISSGWVSALAASITAAVGVLAYLEVKPHWRRNHDVSRVWPRPGRLAILGVGLAVVALMVASAINNHTDRHQPALTRKSTAKTTSGATYTGTTARAKEVQLQGARAGVVALSLHASATVYVCLIGDDGRKLIPGRILSANEVTPVYRAKQFSVTLGNSSVTMYIDGKKAGVPSSLEAIGYMVTATGRRRLAPGQSPTCA